MIKCSACGSQIRRGMRECPGCGLPHRSIPWARIALTSIVLAVVGYWMFSFLSGELHGSLPMNVSSGPPLR
jgi:hypothetical protein